MSRIENLSTEEIERRFDLLDRMSAVVMACRARDYLLATRHGIPESPLDRLSRIQAIEILSDGIKNALDGRSTGDEWRNVRHTYNIERDGPQPPNPADRRCQTCGALNYPPFSHCNTHGGK